MLTLPLEVWLIILDQSVLVGFSGILRGVCKSWCDYLDYRGRKKTEKREIVRTIPLLQYALSSLSFKVGWACDYVVKGKHIEVLKWILENKDKCSYVNADRRAHLEMLTWRHKN